MFWNYNIKNALLDKVQNHYAMSWLKIWQCSTL